MFVYKNVNKFIKIQKDYYEFLLLKTKTFYDTYEVAFAFRVKNGQCI